jgi:hypothetical protein
VRKALAGFSYAGWALANAALGYFTGIERDGFHRMDRFDWLIFSLVMSLNLFLVIRALANDTFSDFTPPNTTTSKPQVTKSES